MSTAVPTYTQEQARAIEQRGVSVALSAGAGCGKTFVLTGRFLAELDPEDPGAPEPAELGELVAITFTERAAREMRDRIRRRCYDRLRAAPAEQTSYWLALLRAIDRARVSTIHAFCASLLRQHAVEAGVDPQFEIIEQAHAATFSLELVNDWLRERLAARDETVIRLAALRGLERLRSHLLRLLPETDHPSASGWLVAQPEQQLAAWAEFHRKAVVPAVLRGLSESLAARQLLDFLEGREIRHAKLLRRTSTLCEMLPRLAQSKDPQEDVACLREATLLPGAGGKGAWPSEAEYDQYKVLVKAMRDLIDRKAKLLQFDSDKAEPAAQTALQVWRLACAAGDVYRRRKRELGLLDFGDLLILARRLLADPDHEPLRRSLESQIRLLLVDEFQDTDPLQVELVRALCGDGLTAGRLFFVGDFKQSIYRFRGADPHVFRELQHQTPAAGRLPLTRNFRSQPAILDFVNALFFRTFGSDEALTPNRKQVTAKPAIEFMWNRGEGHPRGKGLMQWLRREEAEWIARRIRGMLDAGEPIVGEDQAGPDGTPAPRPVRQGDVALLFRALSDVQQYEEALRSYGIDYYLVGGHAFYAQQEIFDLLNLLRSLASPCDEISLAGVLRSPFFSLPDEALFWLGRGGNLARNVHTGRIPEELTGEPRERTEAACRTLRELWAAKDRLPVAGLIKLALEKTGYDAALVAEFLGARKLANLHKLLQEARSFDRAGLFGLYDFIVQLSQFVAAQPREPLAATHPEAMDVVRLMTVHQAKGLEFPVVFVPDVDRPLQAGGSGAAFDPQLGPLVQTGSENGTAGYELWQCVETEEDKAEMDRLLYVACTRAADHLILSGGIDDFAAPQGPWAKRLAEAFDLENGECLVRLPEDYHAPEVRVHHSPPHTETKPSGKARRKDLGKLIQRAVDLAEQEGGTLPESVGEIPADAAARRNFSFSQLSGKLRPLDPPAVAGDDAPEASEPRRSRLDAPLLGSLAHAMLEQVAFGAANDLAAMARRLAPQFSEDAALVDEATRLIETFLASPRAAEIAGSSPCHRELEFLLAWPPDGSGSAGQFLEGFIDCLYRNARGDWVVLDYKTNQTTLEQLAETAAPYEMQLGVYALAAEKILGQPPSELVLHFLRVGAESRFPWNDQRRAQTVEAVSRALRELRGSM